MYKCTLPQTITPAPRKQKTALSHLVYWPKCLYEAKVEDGRGGGLQISLALMSFKLKESVEKWSNISWRSSFDWSHSGFLLLLVTNRKKWVFSYIV